MQIVKPYAVMLNPESPAESFTENDGLKMLKRIEYYARVSHRSEDAMTADSCYRFIRSVVLQHGDMSVIEHEKVTVEALVDRGITHEWVRHRIGSYTQESTRFVNYAKKGGEAKVVEPPFDDAEQRAVWHDAMQDCERAYMRLVDLGAKPQIARSVFPTGLASKIIVTFNLRTWRHFFIMRTSKEAHPQMKQVTLPLLTEFKRTIPILFEDIEPEQRQAESMRLLR